MRKIIFILMCTQLLGWSGLRAEEKTISYQEEKIHYKADYIEFDQQQNILFGRGNFYLIQGATELIADEATINLQTKNIVAKGHVKLIDKGAELYGDEVHYDMTEKKGSVVQGVIYQRPWIIYGPSMEKISDKKTIARHARITSCDLMPPHYYLSTSKVFMSLDEYLWAFNSALWVDQAPVIYLPVFFKALGEKTYSLDIRPGYSKREGIQVKSRLGLPLGSYMYGKLYVDYFEIKGTGTGAELNYFKGDVLKGSLYGYHITERDTMQERWNLRGAHWQQLNSIVKMQSNIEFQSDTDFNNTYFKESYDRIIQKLKSDLAFTAQTAKTTTRLLFDVSEEYDVLKGKFTPQTISAPQLTMTTTRLEIGKSRWYYTLNGAYNHTYSKSDDFYRQSGNSGLSLTRTVRLTRSTTFKPGFSYSEFWQDRQSNVDVRDQFYGKSSASAGLRQRITRRVDVDLTHDYTVRSDINTIKTDTRASDKGIETNHTGVMVFSSLGRLTTLKVNSGYDFHKNKNEIVQTYKQKMDQVQGELLFNTRRAFSCSFRDTYDFYPRQNVGFGGDVKTGMLQTNWSYLKAAPGTVNMYHTVPWQFTPKTYINFGIRYIASGPNRMNYDRINITEQTLAIVRDLHCFEFRIAYTKRGIEEEVLFNLQLKADMQRKEHLFNRKHEGEFYPWRDQ